MYRLVICGDRAHFTTLAFDPDKGHLSILANYEAPYNASWAELVSTKGSTDRLVSISEGSQAGFVYSFEMDNEKKTSRITSQQPTLEAPTHFTLLRDRSALALGTYLGGSIALYSVSVDDAHGLLFNNTPRTEILPDFPYKSIGHGPNKVRQDQCHIHQVVEDRRGLLYAPDLGSDRVLIVRREDMKADICGWLQCPPGTGPRHAVLSHDESILYVVGELSHTVIAFDISSAPAQDMQCISGFEASVIPPNVPQDQRKKLDSGEICRHPTILNVIYVSNRWEKHYVSSQQPPSGDAIAIILLSSDGRKVENVKHVRTHLDVIRGMQVSPDGKYVAAVGQEGGGVEVYQISGDRGEEWALAARLSDGLENGTSHCVWL